MYPYKETVVKHKCHGTADHATKRSPRLVSLEDDDENEDEEGDLRNLRKLLCIVVRKQASHDIIYSESPTVARMTSSGVVRPASTLRMPSSRRVRMPISRARVRRTEEETFS